MKSWFQALDSLFASLVPPPGSGPGRRPFIGRSPASIGRRPDSADRNRPGNGSFAPCPPLFRPAKPRRGSRRHPIKAAQRPFYPRLAFSLTAQWAFLVASCLGGGQWLPAAAGAYRHRCRAYFTKLGSIRHRCRAYAAEARSRRHRCQVCEVEVRSIWHRCRVCTVEVELTWHRCRAIGEGLLMHLHQCCYSIASPGSYYHRWQ